MPIRKNESKACDAIVRVLEKRTGDTRREIRYPEKDGIGPPVDLRLRLGIQEYAIEHTQIEPFENQIGTGKVFRKIIGHIKEKLPETLPGSACYELHLPIEISLPKKKAKRYKALNNLVDWIKISAQCLHKRNLGRVPDYSPYRADDCIQGTPAEFDCEIELLRWPDAAFIHRQPGCFRVKLLCPNPDKLEGLRRDRLSRAFSKKSPKLQKCKAEAARTVLVLESRDIVLTSFDLIGNQLAILLAECTDAPDEIYLVETGTHLWWVWPMKHNDNHWPTVGMPEFGHPVYDSDKLPTLNMPKRNRDALQLDEVFVPYLQGWVPTIFEERELNA